MGKMINFITAFYNLEKTRRNQWLRKEQLEEIQQKRLKKLIKHAYENTIYYRKLFDSAGLKPEDINGPDDLSKIPITTKARLQELSLEERLAKGVDKEKCIKISTSGSTGIPLKLYFSKEDKARMRLFILRAHMANGRKYLDNVATIAGSNYTEKFWLQRLGIMRRVFIRADEEVKTQVKILKNFKPDMIIGIPSALRRIAEVMIEDRINGISPRFIKTGAEVLDQRTREIISSGFKTNVVDAYGAYECGNIAWECSKHSGYHVDIDSLVVEFIKEGRRVHPGETGEVIVTNLNAYAMPIIRYRLGDVCVTSDEQCSCGRGLPLIKNIAGRSDDFIILSDGRSIQPAVFRRIMRSIEGVKQFKIVQETQTDIYVKIVRGKAFRENNIPQLQDMFKKELEQGVRVNIDFVERVELERSGKLRSVVSKISRGSNV